MMTPNKKPQSSTRIWLSITLRMSGFTLALLWPAGTWWWWEAWAMMLAILLVRTALEDRALHKELPGYPAYAQKTRYRLIPGVW